MPSPFTETEAQHTLWLRDALIFGICAWVISLLIATNCFAHIPETYPLLRLACQVLPLPLLLIAAISFAIFRRDRELDWRKKAALQYWRIFSWQRVLPLYGFLYLLLLVLAQVIQKGAELCGVTLPQQTWVDFAKTATPLQYAVLFISAGILAPVAEELFFRHVLFLNLKRIMPYWTASIIQAGLFAMLHANLLQFAGLFLLGIVLQKVYWHDRCIVSPIVLHILVNLTSLIVLIFLR